MTLFNRLIEDQIDLVQPDNWREERGLQLHQAVRDS